MNVSSEGIQSSNLSDLPTIGAPKKAKKGPSYVGGLSLGCFWLAGGSYDLWKSLEKLQGLSKLCWSHLNKVGQICDNQHASWEVLSLQLSKDGTNKNLFLLFLFTSFFLFCIYLTLSLFEVFFLFTEAEHLYDTSILSLEEAVRHNRVASKTSKKVQEHLTTLEERKALLSTEVAELLKKNRRILEVKREKS